MGKTATIIGATGLIGSHVLKMLQDDPYYASIKVVLRRAVPLNHPKTHLQVIDFTDDAAFKAAIAGSDAVFSTVGTTQKQVKGDKVAYRKVDFDIPVHAAQFCVETGCPHFLLVSSVGANSKSNSFYIKLKGEVEDRIGTMNIRSISIFRPSMLLGKREEHRFAEGLTQTLFNMFSFLIPSKFKPVEASDVARAMVAASKQETSGVHVYHYADMMAL
jgi:uncharacterized protein YbjT (DUF2867 family)